MVAFVEGVWRGGAVYAFGECELDELTFELRRNGSVVHVEPQVLDVLRYLIAHRDRVVTKSELLDNVWGGRLVTESALTSRLKAVRRAVGDDGRTQSTIRTVHSRGYQFVAPVTERVHGSPLGVTHARAQEIRYCTTPDRVRIAYACSGVGPPLVKAANWMTHLALEWDNPVWGHWLEALSSGHRLVRYDERGCGLSDWQVTDFSFDAWVEDLRLVVDAAGLDRFPLLGVSQGAAVAIAFAVAHPERVTHLVLVGAYGRGRMVRASTPEEREEAELDIDLVRVAWRRDDDTFRQVFATQFLPDATPEHHAAFNALQRSTTSADNAGRFLQLFAHIDVSDVASRVACPTLVVHAKGDLRVPAAQARELAAAIPDSRLVMVDSANHLLVAEEAAWPVFIRELDSFLGVDAA
ncbi:MAG: alpha/beta fold hydrolase [Ilumatobacteraceae bacterium]